MKSIRLLSIALMLSLVSGCAFFNKECTGDDCGESELLNNQPVNEYWYCYGNPDQTWKCTTEPSTE